MSIEIIEIEELGKLEYAYVKMNELNEFMDIFFKFYSHMVMEFDNFSHIIHTIDLDNDLNSYNNDEIYNVTGFYSFYTSIINYIFIQIEDKYGMSIEEFSFGYMSHL